MMDRLRRCVLVLTPLAAAIPWLGAARATAQPCEPRWGLVSGLDIEPGVDGTVHAVEVFDDGSGPALFLGGQFTITLPDGSSIENFAKWNGTGWERLDDSAGIIDALETFDGGAGPALYVGGTETYGPQVPAVRRWTGAALEPVGVFSSSSYPQIHGLVALDDGSGAALYAMGRFAGVDGIETANIARWDGQSWAGLGAGVGTDVYDAVATDLGQGGRLFAAVRYYDPDMVRYMHALAEFDGLAWHVLTGTMVNRINDLVIRGFEPAIYIAGHMYDQYALSWYDGQEQLYMPGPQGREITALAEHEGVLYAATNTGGVFRELPGSAWGPLAAETTYGGVRELEWGEVAGEQSLFAAGLTNIGEFPSGRVSRWDGASWRGLSPGRRPKIVEVVPDGEGRWYVLGSFRSAGGVRLDGAAVWNGSAFTPLKSPMPVFGVRRATMWDDGTGPALYVGGVGVSDDPDAAWQVIRWDGHAWTLAGTFAGVPQYLIGIWTLHGHNDGEGPALYVGGEFTRAGGVAARNIARFDGERWSALGEGVDDVVSALASGPGGGADLYVGGHFLHAGGAPASAVARWDGQAWSPLGGGVSFGQYLVPWVFGLAWTEVQGEDRLVAAGTFTSPGRGLAQWDGSAWSALMPAYTLGGGRNLRVAASGNTPEPRVYIGGEYSLTSDGRTASNFAGWGEQGWMLPSGEVGPGWVRSIVASETPGDPSVLVAADFFDAQGRWRAPLGVWRECPVCVADFDGDGGLTLADFMSFRDHYVAAHPRADLDGDGDLTLNDFVAFRNTYLEGCG